MAGTITRGKAIRADFAHWDGVNTSVSRLDASGGTVTGLPVGNEVDVLQVYGGGTQRTAAALTGAKNAIGSRSATLVFAPGTWTIDTDVTLPSTLTCRVPAGCVFSVDSGVTLTFNGLVFVEDPATWESGSGTITTAGAVPSVRTAVEKAVGVMPVNFAVPSHEQSGIVNLMRYRPDPTGTTSSQTAINRALAVAKAARCPCYFPGGFYLAEQIVVPNGVIVYGAGIGEYGAPGDVDNVTVMVQADGVNDDFIIFDTDFVDGFQRLQNGGVRRMVLRGNSANTAGHAISFRCPGDRTDDANHAIVAGTYQIDQLLIRGFREHGIHARRGLVGNVIWSNVGVYFCGGYGLNVECITNLGHLTLFNCGGDGNAGGAAINVQTNYRDAIVDIYGFFAEYRTNEDFGATTGFNAAQPYGIRIGNFGSTSNRAGVVNIFGGYTMSSYNTSPTTREAPDAAILVDVTANDRMPEINIFGVQTVDETTPTITSGNGSLLYDVLNGTRISSSVKSTFYSRRSGGFALQTGQGHVVVGGTGEFSPLNTGDNGLQIRGATPGLSLRETDAADANEGTWQPAIASAGELSERIVSDDGTSQVMVWNQQRTGMTLGLRTYNPPMRFTNSYFELQAIPTYADEAAASSAGLASGRLYRTSTGEVRIKL